MKRVGRTNLKLKEVIGRVKVTVTSRDILKTLEKTSQGYWASGTSPKKRRKNMNAKKKRRRKIILPPGYPTPKEIARVLKIPKKEQKQVDQILKKVLKPKKDERLSALQSAFLFQ